MPDPALIDCPAGQFTLIAENVLTGMVHRMTSESILYEYTYRETGQAAPADPADVPEVVRLFENYERSVPIESDYPIDVYIYIKGEIAGKVRVDI